MTSGHRLTSVSRLNRKCAITPLAKSLRLHAKRMIKARPVIFPCKRRGQFHKLGVREFLAKLGKQHPRNLNGSLCHSIGVFEH